MQIFNKKTREIVAIIEEDNIVLNKEYDCIDNDYVITKGNKIYVDLKRKKILNIKDYM